MNAAADNRISPDGQNTCIRVLAPQADPVEKALCYTKEEVYIMKNFAELFDKVARNDPDRVALKSVGDKTVTMSYRETDIYSARIYRWLKENGIGKEDFVLICLPRGILIPLCVLGILKAGAAFVIVEDTYSPERIRYIEKDCGCKLKLDLPILAEMLQTEPLSGYEDTDPHDAAYAVYTSGTTGHPKGVLHEYGNIDENLRSACYNGVPSTSSDDIFGLIAPLNFVASAMAIFNSLSRGSTLIIIPYTIARDTNNLIRILNTEKITCMFMPAAYIRIYDHWSPYLKRVFFGSEPANGLSIDGPELFNVYGMSECGFDVCVFRLDRAYEHAPIGKPQFNKAVFLMDENGQSPQKGDPGEICVENHFVRGYINLPEKTAEVFVNGIYHTGDIARMDENGNLTVIGRKDDMIKINGNRIEPAEIEACCRKVLGLRTVVAKGFSNAQRAYICLYYLNGEAEKAGLLNESGALSQSGETIRGKLEQMLPYYMIPTYYIGLDQLPLNPNGKLNKKALEPPASASFQSEYNEPTNAIEKKICDAFAAALGLSKVGIRDDFYLIGGDSMSSIKALSLCELPGLSVVDLYNNRTAEKLAAIYAGRYANETKDIAADNEKALQTEQPLLPEQINVVDNQMIRASSTMWNLSSLVRLSSGITAEAFAKALNEVIRNHPALLSVIYFSDENELVQKYRPELFTEVPVVELTEQELEERKAGLIRHYRILNSLLFRAEVYRTEKNCYFFFDVHHSVFDGTSYKVFLDEIEKKLKDPEAELETDYYFLELSNEWKLRQDRSYSETVEAYDKRFAGLDVRSLSVRPDLQTMNRTYGTYHADLQADKTRIVNCRLYRHMGGNAFFMTAMMLAVAEYNHSQKAAVQWIYNGRDTLTKQNSLALLYKTMPAIIDLTGSPSLEELCDDVLGQIRFGAAHNSCPYVYIAGLADADVPCFLYQNDMYSVFDRACFAGLVELPEKSAASDAAFELELIDNSKDDSFHINVEYSSAAYREESVTKVVRLFEKYVKQISEAE